MKPNSHKNNNKAGRAMTKKKPHTQLINQLKKTNISFAEPPATTEAWHSFLSLVNRVYHTNAESRTVLEHSLEASEGEMHNLHENLKEETEQRLNAVHKSEEKMQFMANMSHEIRTPVHGILGSLEIVKGTELNEQQQLFVNTAYVSCEAMLDVINNILDYSKLHAEKLDLQCTEFSLQEVVEDVHGIMSMAHPDKPVEVLYHISEDLPTRLRGDASRIRQMLINLIGNGLKFTEIGEVYTRIEVLAEKEKKITLRFEVRDTGIGIPEKMQQKVFKSFVQVDSSSTRRYDGTGLGLTIVKEFAELMEGKVGVESVEGKGSIFWFEINLDRVDEDKAIAMGLEGLKVLVVDDIAANRSIFKEYLNSWGATSVLAKSASEALEILKQSYAQGECYDLLLLDWYMPGMNGLELAKQVSEDPRYVLIPKVLLSSYDVAQEKLDNAGIQAALTKPIRSSTLKNVLIDVMNTKSEESLFQGRIQEQVQSTVLLAEDNEVNALIAKTMLEDSGFKIDHVEDGKQVVMAMKNKEYKVILMDVNMPNIDGYTATQLIREWESDNDKASIPIIAMTANALKGDREKCIEVGMDDYLAKPVSREDLIKKVRYWMEKQEEGCLV